MKKVWQSGFYYVWFIVVAALTMMFLMWAVYLIPVEKIRPNVVKSMEKISDLSFSSLPAYGGIQDHFTDILILNEVSFWGRDPLQDALLNPRVEPAGRLDQGANLSISVQTQGLKNLPIVDYGRYWHGHLLFLKPLFVFFDLQGIRYINLFVQLSLFIGVLFLLSRRLNFKYSLAYLFSMFFLNPLTSWQCLQYAASMNIMLLTTVWVLLNKNPNDKYIFIVTGAITQLFDFLTFPLITLGIPLIVHICLYNRSFKENIICVIKNSLLWGVGYGCLLLGKWSLATLLTDQNILSNGWANVLNCTKGIGSGKEFPLAVAIWFNLEEYHHQETWWCFALFVLCIAMSWFVRSYKVKFDRKALIVLGIGLMPFAWYFVLTEHSFVHHFFTYRILTITIYAILTSMVCCLCERKKANARK